MNDLHLGLSSFDGMTRADKDASKIRLEFASSTVHLQIIYVVYLLCYLQYGGMLRDIWFLFKECLDIISLGLI